MGFLAILCSGLLIAFDQFTKYMALTRLKPISSVNVINGILNLTYVENRGAAFGILQEWRWFFIVLTALTVGGIIYYYNKLPKQKPYGYIRLALILIGAGAVGNCIDRLMNGFVVDFFHARFIDFPVFNMADIYVVTGTILLSIMLIFFVKDDILEAEKENAA